MRDMPEGIRHEHLDSVFVFRASLEMLLKESDMLIRHPPTRPFEGHLNFRFEVEDAERLRGL